MTYPGPINVMPSPEKQQEMLGFRYRKLVLSLREEFGDQAERIARAAIDALKDDILDDDRSVHAMLGQAKTYARDLNVYIAYEEESFLVLRAVFQHEPDTHRKVQDFLEKNYPDMESKRHDWRSAERFAERNKLARFCNYE